MSAPAGQPPVLNELAPIVPGSTDGWTGIQVDPVTFPGGLPGVQTTDTGENVPLLMSAYMRTPLEPGQVWTVSALVEVSHPFELQDGGLHDAIAVTLRAGAEYLQARGGMAEQVRTGVWRVTRVIDIPDTIEDPRGRLALIPSPLAKMATGVRMRLAAPTVVAGERPGLYPAPGITPPPGWVAQDDGAGGVRLVDSFAAVSAWARTWWGLLPQAYQRLDADANPELGGWPLLRFMGGAAGEAARLRAVSDAWWGGQYTDPGRVPDGAPLRWLAQLMGVRTQGVPDMQVRGVLQDIAAGGRQAVGTRALIAEAARRALTGDRQVAVVPSAQDPHRLVVLVRADQLTAEGLAAVVREVREAGVVPAGHVLVPQQASATWDQWSAAAGATWDEIEQRLITWNDSDSAGVALS